MPDAQSSTIDPAHQSMIDRFEAIRTYQASDQQHRDLATLGKALVSRLIQIEARVTQLETERTPHAVGTLDVGSGANSAISVEGFTLSGADSPMSRAYANRR